MRRASTSVFLGSWTLQWIPDSNEITLCHFTFFKKLHLDVMVMGIPLHRNLADNTLNAV